MARPQTHRAEDFVRAAFRIVDSEGLEALTFRRLGAELGVSYTTVYTYFESRDALVTALMDTLLEEIVHGVVHVGTTPHEKLMELLLNIRRIMAQHPLWISTFMSTSTGSGEDSNNALRLVVSILEDAGIAQEDIAKTYRVIEGYVMGSTAFDFSAAPEHISSRCRRYRGSGHKAFVAIGKSEKSVISHNEESFAYGLDRLLTALGV
jgi:AcrR family transcriptional regulator